MWEKVKVKHVVHPVSLHLLLNHYLIAVLTCAIIKNTETEKVKVKMLWNY